MIGFQSVGESETGVLSLRAEHDWASRMPEDTQWFAATCERSEIGGWFHIHSPAWHQLSAGTGLVSESAMAIAKESVTPVPASSAASKITWIATNFDQTRLGKLIVGTNRLETGPYMILDGNHRSVALELLRSRVGNTDPIRLDVFLALSRSVLLRPW